MDIRHYTLVTFLLLIISSCSDSYDKRREVKVGVLLGNEYQWQDNIKSGIEAYQDNTIQDFGCKYPTSIKFVYKRNISTQEQSAKAARELINDNKVDFILGPNISDTVQVAAQIAETSKIPLLTVTSSLTKLTKDKKYVFQFVVDNATQAKLLAGFLHADAGFRSGGIIYKATSEYSRGFANDFTNEFKNLGGSIPLEIDYISAQKLPIETISKLKKAKLDFIFLPNFSDDVISIATELSSNKINALMVGGDSWNVGRIQKHPLFGGAMILDHWHHPTIEQQNLSAELGSILQKSVSPLAYDATKLLNLSLCSIAELNSDSIADSLRNLTKFNGVTGQLHGFSDGMANRSMVMIAISNGNSSIIKELGGNGKH